MLVLTILALAVLALILFIRSIYRTKMTFPDKTISKLEHAGILILHITFLFMLYDTWLLMESSRSWVMGPEIVFGIIAWAFAVIAAFHLLVLVLGGKSWLIWPLRLSVWLATVIFIYLLLFNLQELDSMTMKFATMAGVVGGGLSILGDIFSRPRLLSTQKK